MKLYLEEPHVVNQEVQQSDLVHEARSHVEAVWVDGDAVDLLPELLGELQAEGAEVPDPDGVILRPRHHQRLPVAHVQPPHRRAVERVHKDGEHILLGLPMISKVLIVSSEHIVCCDLL